jgi:intracellular septation protein
LRSGLFFFVLARLNEGVRLTQSWDFWAGLKNFGIMPLTAIFALFQTRLMMKHEFKQEAEQEHF